MTENVFDFIPDQSLPMQIVQFAAVETFPEVWIPAVQGDASVIHNMKLGWAQAFVGTSGTPGNRKFKMQIIDGNSNVLWESRIISIAAAAEIFLNFMPRAKRSASYLAGQLDVPMPNIAVPTGGTLRLFDSAEIDPDGDVVTLRGECRQAGALAGFGFGG